MQLNISELDDNLYNENLDDYEQHFESQTELEKIPENSAPIKVIKKSVHFDDSVKKPTHQSIPRVNAKMVRPQMPQQKPKISYEDILSKMGMFVSDGKLHLLDRNTLTPQKQEELLYAQRQQYKPQQYQEEIQEPESIPNTNIPNNSYIYNKYFKDELKQEETVRRPRTLQEYKMMLLQDYLQKQRIKQMKSTKLVMPTSNINISAGNTGNLNKLFNFSKR
jgi:hypothetical protein